MRSRKVVVASSFTLVLLLLLGWTSSSTSSKATTGKRIAKLSIAVDSRGVESDDPAYGSSAVVVETTLPLLNYAPRVHSKLGALEAGLATAIPTPTNHGKTYKFHLKRGIKYSNGKPILASDFKWAIKRLYLANSYPSGKFALVKGAAAFGKARKGDIPGIIANNKARTITFKLTAPMPTFVALMGQYFTAPVPGNTPIGQDNNIPSTGPMMVKKFTAGQSYTLVKNPHFTQTNSMHVAKVDTIVATVVSDPNVALSQTLSGTYDFDTENVPPDQLGDLLSKHANQTVSVALAATNMFSLNASMKPFNDVRARQAVNYAIDRVAMAKLSGGLQLPTQNILPPTESSYKKITTYTYDLDKAKSLVQAAGATGAKVTVLASGDSTSAPQAVYLTDKLNQIGFNAKVNVVPASTFFGVPSVPSTDPESSWYPWNELIPDASDWIGQLFDGRLINPSHNNNWSMFNDPGINTKITAAEALPFGAARDAAWAALDRTLVVNHAAVVPYGNPVLIAVFAPRLDPRCYTQFVGGDALFSNFCLK
jgi:peptide/nickel transport system substrate-binding protein